MEEHFREALLLAGGRAKPPCLLFVDYVTVFFQFTTKPHLTDRNRDTRFSSDRPEAERCTLLQNWRRSPTRRGSACTTWWFQRHL